MTGYVPAAVPSTEHWHDPGTWREYGVTHWHLTLDEIATTDKDRHDAERLREVTKRGRPTADPHEALVWLCEQRIAALRRAPDPAAAARKVGWDSEHAWLERTEITWTVLTGAGRTPAGGGIALSEGRSIDIFAVPQTARDCTRHPVEPDPGPDR